MTLFTPETQVSTITIKDKGELITLDYPGLIDFHEGDSWWGCAVGFRALQCATAELSETGVLERDNLCIVSGHPGPGVKDAIDYISQCISNDRFRLLDKIANNVGCSRDMTFEWWFSHGSFTLYVKLIEDFVPESFYEVLDRLRLDKENEADLKSFGDAKESLSKRLWNEPLGKVFEVTRIEKPLREVSELSNLFDV